jgi:hypothetical protein
MHVAYGFGAIDIFSRALRPSARNRSRENARACRSAAISGVIGARVHVSLSECAAFSVALV